ncbi:MAG: hypothetical protein GY778_31205 [bacterium]|nr:hypothetical protein [bacterium]
MVIGALLTVLGLTGCGPFATGRLVRPRDGDQYRFSNLKSVWAHFALSEQDGDRLLLGWPLPGARTGRRHYQLYVRIPSPKGVVAADASIGSAKLTGFLVQQLGSRVDLTRIETGSLSIGSENRQRSGKYEMTFADGTTLRGRFRANRSDLALRFFEEDHAGDLLPPREPAADPATRP